MFVILFSVKANSSIYIVDNYSFKTSLKKIKNNRNKVIEDIKKKSLNDFLKSITIQSDYKNIKKINNYQNYFKYFIVKDELKTNKVYEVICKIEFDKFKLIESNIKGDFGLRDCSSDECEGQDQSSDNTSEDEQIINGKNKKTS